eukprot:1716550-Prymnesium_polylepis.1
MMMITGKNQSCRARRSSLFDAGPNIVVLRRWGAQCKRAHESNVPDHDRAAASALAAAAAAAARLASLMGVPVPLGTGIGLDALDRAGADGAVVGRSGLE